MSGYKINLKNESESLEAQRLFKKLGYELAWDRNKMDYEPNHIFAKNGVLTWLHNDPILYKDHENTEITLDKLKDMTLVEQSKQYMTKDCIDGDLAATEYINGKNVQWMLSNGHWIDVNDDTTIGLFKNDGAYAFRVKK